MGEGARGHRDRGTDSLSSPSRIDVVGSDVSLDVGFDITVGTKPSTGTVTICEGGQLTLGAAGRASVGATAGSQGTATVDGSGSLLDAGAFLGIGRDIEDQPAGTGTLTVSNGGTAKALTIHCGDDGTINGDGGTLIGDVVIDPGCNFSPGTSPGALSIIGSFASRGAKIVLEVDANGNYDVIGIRGVASFDLSTQVEVRVDPDFHPPGAAVLKLITVMQGAQESESLLTLTVPEAGVPRVEVQGDLRNLTTPVVVVPAILGVTTARFVEIDILPGSPDNTMSRRSAGLIPVAILRTPAFDPLEIDPLTITLNGASVKLVGRGERPLCESRDVNADGLIDLVCQVLTDQFQIQEGEAFAELEAATQMGVPVRGSDFIRIGP